MLIHPINSRDRETRVNRDSAGGVVILDLGASSRRKLTWRQLESPKSPGKPYRPNAQISLHHFPTIDDGVHIRRAPTIERHLKDMFRWLYHVRE